MSNFTNLITFYASTISDFLLSEPIVYLFGAIIILFSIKVLSRLMRINK